MTYSFDGFEVDETRFRLYQSGRPVVIQPRPLQLLIHLVRNRHRLVHRQEVLETLWPGLRPSQASLDRAVRSARRALGDRGHEPRFIATVRNVGFRFLPDVDSAGSASSPPGSPLTEARVIELLLEVAELSLQMGRDEHARRRALEAAVCARSCDDGDGVIRAALVLSRSVNGSGCSDPEVMDVARDALARMDGAPDPRFAQLRDLVSN